MSILSAMSFARHGIILYTHTANAQVIYRQFLTELLEDMSDDDDDDWQESVGGKDWHHKVVSVNYENDAAADHDLQRGNDRCTG